MEVSPEQRFHGTCALIVLHLRRVAHSNDLEAGFDAARSLRMLSADRERFVRECLAADGRLEQGCDPDLDITPDLVKDLQACVLLLNSADPA